MLKWEKLETSGVEGLKTYRTKVPGGWLVMAGCIGIGLVFFPDPKHEWDGKSIDWQFAIDPIDEPHDTADLDDLSDTAKIRLDAEPDSKESIGDWDSELGSG